MSAKDYEICTGIFKEYLSKVSERDLNLMLDDRRIITDEEILGLIGWKLRKFCIENHTDTMLIGFNGNTIIEMKAKGRLLKEIIEELEGENK